MAIQNKKYKRLSEISDEERSIIIEILNKSYDPRLVSIEFGIDLEDLKTFKEKNNSQLEERQEKLNVKTSELGKIKKADEEKKPISTLTVQNQSQKDNESSSRENRHNRTDNRMTIIRNRYYFISRKNSKLFNNNGNPNIITSEEVDELIAKVSNGIDSKLASTIHKKVEQIEDITKLKELLEAIQKNTKSYNFVIGSVITAIQSRVSKLQLKNTSDAMLNCVTDDIYTVVKNISSGKYDDIDEDRKRIANEAKRRLSNSPKTSKNFNLTERECLNQVFIQIRKLLADRAEEFPVLNPEQAAQYLTQLSGTENLQMNIQGIVNNCVARREYESAKKLCLAYIAKVPYVASIRRKIICSEIGELVCAQIRKHANPKEDSEFMDFLEKRLSKVGVSKGSIILRKFKNGNTAITLEDVWYENKIR